MALNDPKMTFNLNLSQPSPQDNCDFHINSSNTARDTNFLLTMTYINLTSACTTEKA